MQRTISATWLTVALVAGFLVASAPVTAADLAPGGSHDPGAATAAPQANKRVYVVRMLEDPVVAYEGGIADLRATRPARGQKIDPTSADVVRYVGHLHSRHTDAMDRVGGGRKIYDYSNTFNGFAAELTADQAEKMVSMPGVLSVSLDELNYADTSSTPTFLGLDAHDGLWKELGGPRRAGDGIIIGMIDSGIWPESLSFADQVGKRDDWEGHEKHGKQDYNHIHGWHGDCVPGEQFDASMCNEKLIGAQWFNAAWGGDATLEALRPWEFMSARDYNGHGTHTSSTAGGNYRVPTTGPASVFGPINGMAPHARIAMYKALWSTQDGSTASGYTSDLVAAIDQAVADGVDVINYSVSGTLTNFRDPVEIAFMYAADAGVFVACSAGNSGPTTATVAHPGPWLTTVAAGTHNRSALGTATLGNAAVYTGASVSPGVVTAPLIDSINAGMAGASATAVSLCYSTATNGGTPALDPAKVAGKIVVCDRGASARVNKSLAVFEAGGVGMILLNPSNNSLNADFHSVPTVHLQNTDYAAVHAYAATSGPTATISKAFMDYSTPAPYTASFSSRGPLQASGDLLKPDLIAPGQDILAAVAPPGNGGLNFNLYSGTSMSSPHVAGLAALLKDLHKDWSPMMIKSALMTTAYDILDGPNTNPLVIFRQGAGHVKPNSAADPGLVFDSDWKDWMGFLCGTQLPTSFCTGAHIPVLDPSNFNAPSIAIAELAGVQTVTRKVTNVDHRKATYTPSYTGMAGFTVAISPSKLTLHPNETKSFTVTFTQATAALNAYTGGQLTWTDGKHNVRIPMVVRPVALAAPAQVAGSYNVTFGYTGSFTADARGLVPATTFDGSVNTNASVSFTVIVPAGTTYARFSLFDANVSPGSDLDLRVYRGATPVGSSGGSTSAEEVNLLNPTAATYTVYVDGYATANPSTFTLFTWVLGSTAAGNMTVAAPASATLGSTGAINLSFSGLTAGTKYLGSVVYGGAAGMPNPTIVRVDP